VVGCAAALLLTAVTALATNKHDNKGNRPDNKGNEARCTVGGCPGSHPFGYPLGADYLPTSVLALPSPPKTSEEVFYAHGTPAGATNVHPDFGFAFGDGSDLFGSSGGSEFAQTSWPPDLQALPVPQGGMFLFVLRDASDKPIGFGTEMEILAPGGLGIPHNTHASDWIVSIPGRGVLFLNSNDNSTSPDLQTFTRQDCSVVADLTTGPAP
jgi:hypothetical protein